MSLSRCFAIAAASVVALGMSLSIACAADQKQGDGQKKTVDQKAVAQKPPASKTASDKSQTAGEKQNQQSDKWRFNFYNGEWWYWLPTNRWVYWRDNRWNAYTPSTYTHPDAGAFVSDGRGGWVYTNGAVTPSDNRPFYGHAMSGWDWRPSQMNEENRPFYGHAMPSEFFGGWRSRSANRPFYGHAVSSYGD